jgi:S-(hydroxymethyl)glutathione dehydrogenase/alcohol dehydrogenase
VKAAVLRGAGQPLTIEDLKRPEPKQGEVLVKVAACGVCHTDLHVMKGEAAFPLPAVLGHEISGVVERLGPGVDDFGEGDEVVCTFVLPCGVCYYCLKGIEDQCEKFHTMNRQRGVLYDGSTRLYKEDGEPIWMYSMGGMSEYAVVPRLATFRLPRSIPLNDACILGCALFTAYGAAKNQAGVRGGESVAIAAVGGVGLSLVQVAKALGAAQIIAVDIRDEKLEAAKLMGATDCVNSSSEDPVGKILALTGGRGVDIAFEALGRPETLGLAMDAVRRGGKVVAIGLPPGAAVTFPVEISKLVRREIRLIGSYGGRPSNDMPELIKLVEGGRVNIERTITRRYPLERVNEAFDALRRGEIVGRSVVDF